MSRILIVDDQPAVRFGLKMQLALEPGWAVVGEASNGEEALLLAGKLHPDLVLMDVRMPGMDGLVATERLLAQQPDCRVVILSIQDDCDTRARADAAGAGAFVAKTEVDVLMAELRRVAKSRSEVAIMNVGNGASLQIERQIH
jgi:DNA-binding NarL/FixJ family response regulator